MATIIMSHIVKRSVPYGKFQEDQQKKEKEKAVERKKKLLKKIREGTKKNVT